MSEALNQLRRRVLAISGSFGAYEQELEARGFLAQRRHCEVYEREASTADEKSTLRRYWSETRKEYLGTTGCAHISPIHRKVPPCALYRSTFLDDRHANAKSEAGDEARRSEVRDIEACHRRLHEKVVSGTFVDWATVRAQKNAEAHELLQDVTEIDNGGKPIWGEFKDTLKKVSAAFTKEGLDLQSKGKFHYFEHRLASFPTLSGFICHEDEKPLRVGHVAFFIAFAPHGAKIDPSRPPDPTEEARLGFQSILPGFAAYSHFENLEERALCVAAHLFAGDRFFALLES